MNPGGPVEEVGQTARSLITGLSSTPMVLAVLVFNLFYIGATGYIFLERNKREEASDLRWERMLENALRTCAATAPQLEKEP